MKYAQGIMSIAGSTKVYKINFLLKSGTGQKLSLQSKVYD